jgi:ABC-2 type transport system permease protein
MKNTFAVFKREFFAYFNSPVAYIILVIFLLVSQGFAFFFGRFLEHDDASLGGSFFGYLPWIFMVLAPAVGMKLWSEEHRLGTLELLMTMPISPWHSIIGKYLAAAAVWAIALALTFPIVITVFYLGHPDPGPVISGYLGSYLYALACLAISCAVSAFTRSQVICFIISVAICLALTLLGFQQIVEAMLKGVPASLEGAVRLVSYLCLLTHFYDMSKGLVLLRDLLYFGSVIAVCLMITGWALQSRRS